MHLFFRIRWEGFEALPDGPLIICANHISFLDPVLLGIKLPRQLFFMSKAELFKVPVLGWALKNCGAFPVNRGKGDKSALIAAQQVVREGKLLGIFPEGTRSKTGQMLRPKSGAAMLAHMLGADILPISIHCKGRVRIFKKITVRMGVVIQHEELNIQKGAPSELKAASILIMDRIKTLQKL